MRASTAMGQPHSSNHKSQQILNIELGYRGFLWGTVCIASVSPAGSWDQTEEWCPATPMHYTDTGSILTYLVLGYLNLVSCFTFPFPINHSVAFKMKLSEDVQY